MKRAVWFAIMATALSLVVQFAAADEITTFTQCPNFQPLPQSDGDNNAFNGCSALITVNPDFSTTIAFNPQGDVEDTLVGVQNNSGKTIFALNISGEEPFQFDHDFGLSTGPTGYEGPGVSFLITKHNGSSGIVSFAHGIPSGGSAYFGLEGAANSENIALAKVVVPESSSLLQLGTILLGLVYSKRRLAV